MKRRLSLLACLLVFVLLAACGSGSTAGGGDEISGEPDAAPTDDVPEDSSEAELDSSSGAPEAPEGVPIDGERNAALSRVAGLEAVPADCLLGVKSYAREMGWMEANAIPNLERCAVEDGVYLLIVPRYAHSRVVVERMDYAAADFDTQNPVYLLEDCPDDYALILNTLQPEGMPDYRVTVSFGEHSASYLCSYDGRGGAAYPVVRDGVFYTEAGAAQPEAATAPDSRQVDGVFAADIDYGHAGSGYYAYFTAEVPAGWWDVGYDLYAQSWDMRADRLTVRVWGYMDTPDNYHHVTYFLDVRGEVVALPTPAGNLIHRNADPRPDALTYAFELSDGLCVMVDVTGEPGHPATDNLPQHDAAIAALCDSMRAELVAGDFGLDNPPL